MGPLSRRLGCEPGRRSEEKERSLIKNLNRRARPGCEPGMNMTQDLP